MAIMVYWDIVLQRLDFVINILSITIAVVYFFTNLLLFAIYIDSQGQYNKFKTKYYKIITILTILIILLNIFKP